MWVADGENNLIIQEVQLFEGLQSFDHARSGGVKRDVLERRKTFTVLQQRVRVQTTLISFEMPNEDNKSSRTLRRK